MFPRSPRVTAARPWLLLAGGCLLGARLGVGPASAPPLRAQAPTTGAAGAFAQANALFNAGRYPEAAAAYDKLLKDYPTSEVVNAAQVQLGTAAYLSAKFDDAISVLRRFLASPTSAGQNDLLEAAAALLPEALAQRASALPETDAAGRKAAFEETVKEFGSFFTKFPRSAQTDSALLSRATAAYQLARYPEATEDLRRLLREFPAQDAAPSGRFLLALTLATQASQAANAEPPRTVDAAKLYDEAEKLLAALVSRPDDLALANDAQFQLGEVLNARAAGAPDEKTRNALLLRALDAFRAVEPKEPILLAQNTRIEQLKTRLRAAVQNPAELRLIQTALVREQTKLGQLQGREEQALTARLRGTGVYVQLKRYDEARTLARVLQPLATKPADEKVVLATLALTLAAQNAVEPALAAYEKFQAKYAGDPAGENLPLMMGNLFAAGAKPDPARAKEYFEEFAKLYPNSRLREAALTEGANALARQGKFDDALAAFDQVLKGNPKRELAAAAELGRARILKDKGDNAGALAAFGKVRDTFVDRPEAAEAAFWVGFVALQNKDAAGAGNGMKAFLARFPQHPLAPNAQLTLGRAQQAAGDKTGALATWAELPARFPASTEAPQSYFLRAGLLYAEKNPAEMIRVLQEFTERFPADPKLFDAFDTIGAVQSAAQPPRLDQAIATYRTFLDKNPQSPQAPNALLKLAGLQKKTATDLGRFLVLGAPQREAWRKNIESSVASSENLLEKYPDSGGPVALALANLLECQRLLADAKLKTDVEVSGYFAALADRYQSKPTVRSRILFRAAALTAEKDPAKALTEMRAAFDPAVIYSPADLDGYTQALLRAGDAATAAPVFEKLARDYPLPPGVAPAQAPADVQDAQAIALSGQGRLAEARNDFAAAASVYEKLKATYPRSPKIAEANLGLARHLAATGKPEDALKLLSEVARASGASLEARARGILLTGEIFEKRGDTPAAIDTFLKVAAFYPTAVAEASEGLWKGSQSLEKQAANLNETTKPKKSEQLARARKALEDLAARYPASAFAEQAKQKLAGLVTAQ